MRGEDREAGAVDEAEGGLARRRGKSAGERRRRGRASPDVVTVLAILVPGLGHLSVGRLRAAGLWFAAILVGYWAVVLPGVVLHVLSIGSARRAAVAVPAARGPAGVRANP